MFSFADWAAEADASRQASDITKKDDTSESAAETPIQVFPETPCRLSRSSHRSLRELVATGPRIADKASATALAPLDEIMMVLET